MTSIWQISDTHGKHHLLDPPKGIDMVLHTGDGGTYHNPYKCKPDLENCLQWLNNLDAKYKVYVPGNHDTAMEAGLIDPTDFPDVIIINHRMQQVNGLKIFGSPYTPWFYGWAYNAREKEIKKRWEDITAGVDIIATHGPAHMILDECPDGYRAGCPFLRDKVFEIKPLLHQFGHIHLDGGKTEEHEGIKFVNAAVLDESYQIQNNGNIIEL